MKTTIVTVLALIGMTKAQALARYGDPKKHTITDEGEQWVYVLNFGEMMGRAMIPFNFKPTVPRTGVLIFGPDRRRARQSGAWSARDSAGE